MRPITLLLYLSVSASYAAALHIWRRRNLENGKLYEFDGSGSPPGDIARVQLLVTSATLNHQPPAVRVYIFRIRWTESRNAAAYRVQCEATSAAEETMIILNREIPENITGVDERFILPHGELSVICGVAAANEFGSSAWTFSSVVTIQASGVEASESRPEITTSTSSSPIDTKDLSLHQLLELIHQSKVEDLPPLPIEAIAEELIVIRPTASNGDNTSDVTDSAGSFTTTKSVEFDPDSSINPVEPNSDKNYGRFEIMGSSVSNDYESIEEDVRIAIGADERSRTARERSLRTFGLIDRIV